MFSSTMAPTEGASLLDHLPIDYYQPKNDRSVSWLPLHSPDDHDGGDPPPKSVVLDTLVYLDDQTNAYTAEGFTSNGHAIRLTLWPARPPLLSYFTVHLPGLLPDGPATPLDLLPRLLRTDGELALLRVIVGPLHSNPQHNNYIIYRAGANTLEVLPAHPTHLFPDSSVGLLSCRDGGRFFVADLRSTYSRGHYALDLFDSSSGTWSTRPMHAESPQHCYFGSTTKVIAIGGSHGSIGWVDIWNGILVCDLLRADKDDDILRFISLPTLLAPNKMVAGPSFCDRDVAVTDDGCIKYVEVWARPVPGSQLNAVTYVSQDWGVAIVTWLEPEKKWRIDCTLKASEIVVDKNHSRLLPHHVNATRKSPTLSRLHAGHPAALCLHDDDVVHIMTKVDHRNPESWMLAVDMRSKTLKGVAHLSTRRSLSFSSMYFQSGISKHLPKSKKIDISKHLPESKRSSNRQEHEAAKTRTDGVELVGQQEAMETPANGHGVDADASVDGWHMVHPSEAEEQEEEEVTILQFDKLELF